MQVVDLLGLQSALFDAKLRSQSLSLDLSIESLPLKAVLSQSKIAVPYKAHSVPCSAPYGDCTESGTAALFWVFGRCCMLIRQCNRQQHEPELATGPSQSARLSANKRQAPSAISFQEFKSPSPD